MRDKLAEDLRGFGPAGVISMFAVLGGNAIVAPLSAVFALVWRWRSETPWRDMGFVRPRSWARSIAIGIAFGVAFKLVMKAVVMPLLGADPVNQTYHYLAGNTAALPGMLFSVIVGAGFGEEVVFRGYLFDRLRALFGTRARATMLTVLLTSAWFGLVHYPEQGVPGAQQGLVVGLVFGAIYSRTREIWTLMFAHAAFDLAALALIYWEFETAVAQLFWR